MTGEATIGAEQNLDSLAKRSLCSDPHLHPLPNRGEETDKGYS